jgi:hypothetical protein
MKTVFVAAAFAFAAIVIAAPAHADPPMPPGWIRCKTYQTHMGPYPVPTKTCDFGDHITTCYDQPTGAYFPVFGNPCTDYPESDKPPGWTWDQP